MVKWSRRARNDLKSIYDYIAEDSPTNAKKTINTMLSKMEPLAELPNRGKVVPELNNPDIR